MSVCIDDFERQAALRIDQSRKSLSELVVELRTMLESRLYIGEEVSSGSVLNFKIGRVIDCIDLQTAAGTERKYTVLCDGKLHKNLDSAQLKRTRKVSDQELQSFIRRAAVKSFVTQVWSVQEDHWDFYDYAVNRNAYLLWKRTKETWEKEKYSRELKGVAVLLLLFSPIFILVGVILYSSPDSGVNSPIERPNVRHADNALHSMRQMNEATANYFWKWVVADDKLNLADPSALEGIAHLFAFDSTRSNRTTLQAYVKRMPVEPPAIFFAFGESKKELEKVPAVRSLTQSGHEVLLLTDKLDRKVLQSITWFEGKTLMNARWYEHSKRGEESTVN